MPSNSHRSELRLFISSTFRDLYEEREYLLKKVFPEIRAVCRSRGITFTEVDLRWGLTEEEQRLGRIVRTCLEEIERSAPYFIGIIGSRYGWTPEYHEILMDPYIQERYPWIETLSLEGGSLLEMEFRHGLAESSNALFYLREHDGNEIDNPERLAELVSLVRTSGRPLKSFTTPSEFGELVRRDLLELIDAQWPEQHLPSWLERERNANDTYALSRRRAYIPNPANGTRFTEWLRSTEQVLFVTAESGMGKSSLLAWLASERKRKEPGSFTIEHFVGASDDSIEHQGLIRRVMQEIKLRYALEDDIPQDPDELERQFPEWLARVGAVSGSTQDQLVIIIDAADHFLPSSRSFAWFPKTIAPNVKFVVSCNDGELCDQLRTFGWQELRLLPLREREREAIITRYLGEYHKQLPSELLRSIGQDEKSSSPLFVRTLAEELRLHGTHESLSDVVGHLLAAPSLEALFAEMLQRMEADHGADIVRRVATMIAASRSGLEEYHLMGAANITRADLSLLMHALDYHLLRTGGKVTFFHGYLRSAVVSRYLGSRELEDEAHRKLASYYRSIFTSGISGEADRLMIREMLYQYRCAEDRDTLRSLLLDPNILTTLFDGETEYDVLEYWKWLGDEDIARQYLSVLNSQIPDAARSQQFVMSVARLLRATGYWEHAEEMFKKLAEESDSGLDPDQELFVLGALGEINMLRGRLDDALRYFQAHYDLAVARSNRNVVAIASGEIGAIYAERGNYEEAIHRYNEMYERCKELRLRSGMSRALSKLGQVLIESGRYSEAIHKLDEALRITETTGDRRRRIFVLGQIGLLYWNTGRFIEAMQFFTQEMKAAEEIGDRQAVAMARGKIGLVHLDEGDLDAAMNNFRGYLDMTTALGYARGIGFAHGDIGLVHLQNGDYPEAIDAFNKALEVHRTIGFPYGVGLWQRWKAETALRCKEMSLLHASEQWIAEARSIAGTLNNTNARFETDLTEHCIAHILGRHDEARNALEAMLTQELSEEHEAAVHYSLWKYGMSKQTEHHRSHAENLYKTLTERTQKMAFRQRLAELESKKIS